MPKISQKVKAIRRASKLKDRAGAEKELKKKDGFEQSIIDKVNEEYTQAWTFMRPKIKEGLTRLKLYNNQKKDKNLVGDPFLFTNHQTVLAALWEDKLSVEFGGREEGDEEMAENLNGLSEFDYEYDQMDKAMHDYEWDFDTTAFGRGLSYFNEFDQKSKTPIPVVWDPLTFLRDPDATSVHGNRLGQGALRYGGREVTLSLDDLKDNPEYLNLGKLRGDMGVAGNFSVTFEARQARAQAQGTENVRSIFPIKGTEVVLQWLTIFDGEKYLVELGENRTKLIRIHKLEDNKWPLIDRPCYPISHDWDGVSVWDICEDKQRYRASLLNVFGISARADLYPMYLYDETKIKRSIDKNFGFNKWIPVDGPVGDAARPLIKSQPSAQSQFILDFLDISTQRALATPELRQGGTQKTESGTLGELQIVSQAADVRYSLTARLWGNSEQKFWKRWYEIYDRDFDKQIHSKVARIMGTFGPQWREITRDKIITNNKLGPDIKIESRIVSERKKFRTFQLLQSYSAIIANEPNVDRLYFARKTGKLLFKQDEVERILPPTIDEMEAKEENEKLNNSEYISVALDQDHIAHLRVHAGAKDGEEKDAHIRAHRFMLMKKRERPELFPQLDSDRGVVPGAEEGGLNERKSVPLTNERSEQLL